MFGDPEGRRACLAKTEPKDPEVFQVLLGQWGLGAIKDLKGLKGWLAKLEKEADMAFPEFKESQVQWGPEAIRGKRECQDQEEK